MKSCSPRNLAWRRARLEYANLLSHTLNHPTQAEKQYGKTLELNPDSIAARAGLAGMKFREGNLPGALRPMAEAVDIDPSDTKLSNNYGVFLDERHRHPEEAAEQFSNAIADDPTFAAAHDGLGNALQSQGKTREAERMYRKAIELQPDFAAAREHLARLLGQ